jgi:hypothetical protein
MKEYRLQEWVGPKNGREDNPSNWSPYGDGFGTLPLHKPVTAFRNVRLTEGVDGSYKSEMYRNGRITGPLYQHRLMSMRQALIQGGDHR